MKIFDISALQAAQNYTPQIERFMYNSSIYIIEDLSDYDNLPPEVLNWRELVAYSG